DVHNLLVQIVVNLCVGSGLPHENACSTPENFGVNSMLWEMRNYPWREKPFPSVVSQHGPPNSTVYIHPSTLLLISLTASAFSPFLTSVFASAAIASLACWR